jgi:adenylyltransferase/sulfurtransferase
MPTSSDSPRPAREPSALIIGAGGLGHPAALALAASGVRRLGVVDDDRVDASNMHRQILFVDGDEGDLKVAALARGLARRFPEVRVEAQAVRFEVANAAALVAGYDVIVDGSDNFATKFLANDAAVLAGKPLVHGAAIGLGGQLLTVPAGGHPCYRCLFEEPPPAGVGPSCAEAGVLGPVPGVIGALQGAEAARLCAGDSPAFIGRLIQYDSAGMNARAIPFNPNPLCGVCGPAPRIRELAACNYSSGDSRTLSSGDSCTLSSGDSCTLSSGDSRTLPVERCFV